MKRYSYFLNNETIPVVKKEAVDNKLWDKAASFVTVYVDNKLRGCIGDYIATEPLYRNIVKNAVNAAFTDFRFPPIDKNDLPALIIVNAADLLAGRLGNGGDDRDLTFDNCIQER